MRSTTVVPRATNPAITKLAEARRSVAITVAPESSGTPCTRAVLPEMIQRRRGKIIALSGGGSLLKNLDKRLREETGLPVAMAEDPLSSVVLGAGKMLSDFNLLRKISID